MRSFKFFKLTQLGTTTTKKEQKIIRAKIIAL